MAKYVVATVDEIPVGGRKLVEIAGRAIGVFNINGEFYALRNRCPHQGGPLCVGQLTGFSIAETPGEYQYSRKGEILRCPWHGWEFDVRTGQSWFDPRRIRVRQYEVAVEHIVPVGDPPAPGFVPGPYVAEQYPVTIEQDYLVIDI